MLAGFPWTVVGGGVGSEATPSPWMRPRPQRLIRSPSVERLICRSSAALDLLPPVALRAQPIRLASTSFSRSSSEIGLVSAGPLVALVEGGTRAAARGCAPARNRMLADRQPTRTVPHEQVCAIRPHA